MRLKYRVTCAYWPTPEINCPITTGVSDYGAIISATASHWFKWACCLDRTLSPEVAKNIKQCTMSMWPPLLLFLTEKGKHQRNRNVLNRIVADKNIRMRQRAKTYAAHLNSFLISGVGSEDKSRANGINPLNILTRSLWKWHHSNFHTGKWPEIIKFSLNVCIRMYWMCICNSKSMTGKVIHRLCYKILLCPSFMVPHHGTCLHQI